MEERTVRKTGRVTLLWSLLFSLQFVLLRLTLPKNCLPWTSRRYAPSQQPSESMISSKWLLFLLVSRF